MEKAVEIENTLKQTADRLKELKQLRGDTLCELSALQSGYVDGEISIDGLQAARGGLSALEATIRDLETRQSELQTRLKEQSEIEAQEQSLEQATTAAISAGDALVQYVRLRAEFDGIISDYSEKMLNALTKFRAGQRVRREHLKGVDTIPHVFRCKKPETKRELERIAENLSELGVPDDLSKIMDLEFLNLPPVEFALILEGILQMVMRKRGSEEKARALAEKRAAAEKRKAATVEAKN